MSERRSYWVSAGMAFANPVEGGIHCREVWTDDKLETENERLRALLESDWNKALFQNNQLLDDNERLRDLLRECQVYVEGMSSVDSELCERVEKELSDESNRK